MKSLTYKEAKKLPRYVLLRGTALKKVIRYTEVSFTGGGFDWYKYGSNKQEEVLYTRAAGNWEVFVTLAKGVLKSVSHVDSVNNVKLIPTDYKTWRKDNEGYV